MDVGLIGATVGGFLGFAGGAVGTYFGIRKTNGPRERAFMVKTAVIAWIAIIIFIVLLVILPQPYNYLMGIPYGILLPLGITKCNKRQAELRQRENGS